MKNELKVLAKASVIAGAYACFAFDVEIPSLAPSFK
jgi:hypothetical protein